MASIFEFFLANQFKYLWSVNIIKAPIQPGSAVFNFKDMSSFSELSGFKDKSSSTGVSGSKSYFGWFNWKILALCYVKRKIWIGKYACSYNT